MTETKRARRADNRRSFHAARVNSDRPALARLRAIFGWLVSEARRLPADALETLIDELYEVAHRANERSRTRDTQ